MELVTYRDWRETCIALHMMLQMMGKVKLETMEPQPEWGQVLLHAEPEGFSTGLIPVGAAGFEIRLSVADARMEAVTTRGTSSSFSFSGTASIADVYDRFNAMLADVGHPCKINPVPQEMFTAVPFDEQLAPVEFDTERAQRAFEQFLFAQSALSEFSAPFRGKKIPPSLFWGTFDMTTVLFSGRPCPFQGDGSLVERVAFDEQFVEFGFWPGDESVNDPSFFALAYPFLKEGSSEDVEPVQAYYDPNQAEYFLRLEDALGTGDPSATVVRFCQDAFASVAKRQGWNDVEWLFAPLLNASAFAD